MKMNDLSRVFIAKDMRMRFFWLRLPCSAEPYGKNACFKKEFRKRKVHSNNPNKMKNAENPHSLEWRILHANEQL